MSQSTRTGEWTLAIWGSALALGVLALDAAVPSGFAGGVPYVAVVLLALWSSRPRDILWVAAVCTVLTILGYLLSPPSSMPWVAVANRGLALFTIWATAILGFERRSRDQLLAAGEAQYRAIIDALPDPIFRMSTDGVFMGVHASHPEMLAAEPEQIIGRTANDILPPELARASDESLQRLLRTGQAQHLEYQLPLGDRVQDFEARMVRSGKDEVLIIVRNITERKDAERALLESEARFQTVADNAPVMIWMSDTEHRGTYFNKPWLDFTGRPLEDELGFGWLEGVHPDDRELCERVCLDAFELRQTFSVEFRLRRADGAYRWVHDTGVPRYSAEGEFQGFVGSCVDTTEPREAEEALRRSQEGLRRLAGRLIAVREEERAGIAREVHDEFGQALTVLKLDLSWQVDHLADDPAAARQRGQAMLEWVDALLDSVGQLSSRLRPAVLDHLGLPEAIDWQVRDFAKRSGCSYSLSLDAGEIELDSARDTAIFRILQESLTNVVRHAEAEHIDVSLASDDGLLVLEVVDDGRGIRPEEISSATSIGLLGMRERAAAFGGHVDIGPGDPRGTVVRLRMPLRPEEWMSERVPGKVEDARGD